MLTVFVHVLVWVHGRAVKFLSVLQEDQIHILDSSPIADVVDQTGYRAGILENVISFRMIAVEHLLSNSRNGLYHQVTSVPSGSDDLQLA